VGMKTKSTPFGNIEAPANPLTTAIMAGATFVARRFSGDQKHLIDMMKKGIQHTGFALIDIFSPCVTFNHDNDFPFFKERVKRLEDEDHDPTDWKRACEKAMEWGDTIYTGLFFHGKGAPALHEVEPVLDEGGPMSGRALGVSEEQAKRIIQRMM